MKKKVEFKRNKENKKMEKKDKKILTKIAKYKEYIFLTIYSRRRRLRVQASQFMICITCMILQHSSTFFFGTRDWFYGRQLFHRPR